MPLIRATALNQLAGPMAMLGAAATGLREYPGSPYMTEAARLRTHGVTNAGFVATLYPLSDADVGAFIDRLDEVFVTVADGSDLTADQRLGYEQRVDNMLAKARGLAAYLMTQYPLFIMPNQAPDEFFRIRRWADLLQPWMGRDVSLDVSRTLMLLNLCKPANHDATIAPGNVYQLQFAFELDYLTQCMFDLACEEFTPYPPAPSYLD